MNDPAIGVAPLLETSQVQSLMELEKLRARFFDAETGEAALNDW